MTRKLPFLDPRDPPTLVSLCAKTFIQHQEIANDLEWYAELRSRYSYPVSLRMYSIIQRHERFDQQTVTNEEDGLDAACPKCYQDFYIPIRTSWTLAVHPSKKIKPEQLIINVDVA